MTYHENIKALIYKLRGAYNEIGNLRDAANAEEKTYCNNLRGMLNQVDTELQRWEEAVIANGRYNMNMGGGE